ncbi:hypothetical protein H8E52_07470 [bacterium]|nr:hypothetical protein [bacterium]
MIGTSIGKRLERRKGHLYCFGITWLLLVVVLTTFLPRVSLGVVTEHIIPDRIIESVEISGLLAYRIRLPLEAVTSHLQNADRFDAWLEFTAARITEDTGSLSIYACESPCGDSPDQISTGFYKVKLIEHAAAEKVRVEIKSIVLGSIKADYASVDIIIGQFSEDLTGEVRIWAPGEGGEKWKIILSK